MPKVAPIHRWLLHKAYTPKVDRKVFEHDQVLFEKPIETETRISNWTVWNSKCQRYQVVKISGKLDKDEVQGFVAQYSETEDGHNWRFVDMNYLSPSEAVHLQSANEAFESIMRFHEIKYGLVEVVTNVDSILDFSRRNGYLEREKTKVRQVKSKIPESEAEISKRKASESPEMALEAPLMPVKRQKGTSSRPGVIDTIVAILESGWHTREQIHAKLVKEFPDRAAQSMIGTVGVQVPGKLMRDRVGLVIDSKPTGKGKEKSYRIPK